MVSALLNCFQWQVNVFPAQMISLKFLFAQTRSDSPSDQMLHQISRVSLRNFQDFFIKMARKFSKRRLLDASWYEYQLLVRSFIKKFRDQTP